MNPLFFANWQVINDRFRALMWLVAVALALAILAQSLASSSPVQRQHRGSAVVGGSALAGGSTLTADVLTDR